MALYQIPLTPGTAQIVRVPLGDATYTFTLSWVDEAEGGWVLDLGDAGGAPLICGIPLLPGRDLLAPYAYMELGFRLAVFTPGAADAPPTFAGLGADSYLIIQLPD